MSEKWRRSETCTVIFNDKLQGSIAKHLRSDDLLNYTFITQSHGERICKIGEHWRSYRQNGNCFTRPIRIALLFSKTLISPDIKLNNLCIMDRNCY